MNSSMPSEKAAISIHSNPISLVAWTSALVLLILAAPALSIVVFLRRQFGCRFIKLYMVWIAFGLLWTFYSFSGKTMLSATPARVYAVAMMGLSVYHSRAAWNRFWAAGTHPELLWHSMNDGIPRLRSLFPRMGERLLKTVAEPVLVAFAALICFIIGNSLANGEIVFFNSGWVMLGSWLMTAAMAHALYETMLYEQRLHSFIDFIDSNLEASSVLEVTADFAQAKQQQPVQNTLGNPVLFTPDLFRIMEASRRKAQMHAGSQIAEPVQ